MAMVYFKALTAAPATGRKKGVENQGVTINQLDQVMEQVEHRCIPEVWVDKDCSLLTSETVNLYRLVEYIIPPLTVNRNCSYLELAATKAKIFT